MAMAPSDPENLLSTKKIPWTLVIALILDVIDLFKYQIIRGERLKAFLKGLY